VLRDPVNAIQRIGTKEEAAPAAANFAGGSTVWDQLAQCESGGNWAINTGNGYYGGLQFSLSTWRSYGGPGYPHQQSRETQIAIAEKVRAATGGYGSWPACSQSMGLPQ
jgi:resuscitation-promoting factor RpfB